jgi:hypothetical protein
MEARPQPGVDSTTLIVSVITIVSGVAVGLLSDLQDPGKFLGGAAFAAWALAICVLLITGVVTRLTRVATAVAFVLTALLLVYAFFTGPRMNARTLLLTPAGAQAVDRACPGAMRGETVPADAALNQLDDQFIHIELKARCDAAHRDMRLRTDDLRALLPK